jgi:trans-aconitate 2-methyltransferase
VVLPARHVSSGPRDWDAATYDRVADPMTRWGSTVLDRLPLEGDELVLDAGCGSGRVTEQLVERLPRGRVIALDASPAMVDEARRRLARFGERVGYVVAELGRPFDLPGGGLADAILSTATFHWVPDHPTIGDGWLGDVHFETPAATATRLAAAGWVDVETWLQPEPTTFEPGEPFAAYLRTVVLGSHLARLPPDAHDAFVQEVIERLGQPRIDYVRLNIVARRA